ncbi:MAG: Rpn family recombination-promoting nuclease/putative transposase [Microcystaceae cyanobacterium]
MTKKADIGSKRLISLAPQTWVRWVTQIPELQAREIIASDFQWVSRESDVLMRTYSPQDQEEFLVLNELQLRYTNKMPRRMRAYAALAEEKYQIPTYPVLINILPPDGQVEIVERYQSECHGLQARQDYRVINLWEVEVEMVFEQPLPSLLPFVPILKGGGEETQVREALRRLRQDEQLKELETLLAFFATFVLESELVEQIMRWDMAVLLESPWYRQILQEGEKIGREEGRQEGLLVGISTSLELKFGHEGLQLMPEIQELDTLETLEAILKAIKTVKTLSELRQVYRRYSH